MELVIDMSMGPTIRSSFILPCTCLHIYYVSARVLCEEKRMHCIIVQTTDGIAICYVYFLSVCGATYLFWANVVHIHTGARKRQRKAYYPMSLHNINVE